MGVFVFGSGIVVASLVPFCFTLPKQGWLVGLLIFLPMSGYLLFDGVRRLTRMRLELSEKGVRGETRFFKREMAWSDIATIRATVGSDDETRIILTLFDSAGKKIRIPQGTFSVPVLDEIISRLKREVDRHPEIRVDDFRGVWFGWDNYMQVYRKLHPKSRRHGS